MSIKNILSVLLILTSITMKAQNFVWFDGHQPVSYLLQKKTMPVVQSAAELFEEDMKAVTGMRAETRKNASIEIYELDKASKKDFKILDSYQIPYTKFIDRKECFFIGLRNKKMIVVGSDGRGTAYGMLELSRIAGISEWKDLAGIMPEKKNLLDVKTGFECIQSPDTEHRGLSFTYSDRQIPTIGEYIRIFKGLLRMRANLLVAGNRTEEHLFRNKSFRNAAARYGIETEPERDLRDAKILPLTWVHTKDQALQVSYRQPGALYEILQDGHQKTWVAVSTPNKTANYGLSLFMDMAWNHSAVNPQNLTTHYSNWLAKQFGDAASLHLLPLMTEYYRLTGICKPEFLDYATFNTGEFGNEMERYIAAWQDLARRLKTADEWITPESRKAYQEAIQYPILISAAMTRMKLEAQEARSIARPGLFFQDHEALNAAANSLTAYEEALALRRECPNLPEIPAPSLPGKLTPQQIRQYSSDYQDDLQPLDRQLDYCVALNANAFTSASPKATLIPLIGHSNEAVKISQGGRLKYTFTARNAADDEGVIKVATIPQEGCSYTVVLDQDTLKTLTVHPVSSDYLRGQSIVAIPVKVTSGLHTLQFIARSEEVLFDQWMYDNDKERIFYAFPVTYQ